MTKKSINIVIKLSQYFEESVFSRAAIKNLFDFDVKNATSVELDFSDINFISRSAAHQLNKEQRKIENLGILFIVSNVSSNIRDMIERVKKTANSQISFSNTIIEQSFTNKKDISKFLLESL